MPEQGNSPESPQDAPTVPLLARYDEGQVMQIQLMQELLGQMQKNTAMLVKIYEFFIEQSKK